MHTAPNGIKPKLVRLFYPAPVLDQIRECTRHPMGSNPNWYGYSILHQFWIGSVSAHGTQMDQTKLVRLFYLAPVLDLIRECTRDPNGSNPNWYGYSILHQFWIRSVNAHGTQWDQTQTGTAILFCTSSGSDP